MFPRKEMSRALKIPLFSKATNGSHDNFMPHGRRSHNETLHDQEDMGYLGLFL